jgi:hypothetical protein
MFFMFFLLNSYLLQVSFLCVLNECIRFVICYVVLFMNVDNNGYRH